MSRDEQASGWSDIYDLQFSLRLTSPHFLLSSSSSSSGSLPWPSCLPLPAQPVLDPSRRPWLAMPRRHCSLQPTHRQRLARWAAMLRTCQKDGPWQPSLPSLPSMPLQPPDPDESVAVTAPSLTRPHFQRPASAPQAPLRHLRRRRPPRPPRRRPPPPPPRRRWRRWLKKRHPNS